MTDKTEWRIPPSMIRWLPRIPIDRPVAMLLRHSVRPPMAPGDAGHMLPITDTGTRLARELGSLLGPLLRSLHASPVLRCVQTAEALRGGAATDIVVHRDRLLGEPGIYVLDGRTAWSNWQKLGHAGVMSHLVAEDAPLPGMAAPDEAGRFLVQHMLAAGGSDAGFHVFVTHDSLVTATTARILGEPMGVDAWPWYLEAAFFWMQDNALHVAYRDIRRRSRSGPLCGLDDRSVIELARREIARTVGIDCSARFFLAGGAFKTLLTGRPPRDLDLWVPSDRDREIVVATLVGRGGRRLEDRPFGEAFEIDGRIVEVPHKTEPPTLEERLGRCDIALSAVGVEHRPRDRWRAVIHPLAQTSVERKEVILLKPLVNWKYALTTLERVRRYAEELDYRVPPEEEAEVWSVFDSQPSDVRHAMLKRFDRTASGGYRVREEVLCRLR